MLTAVISPEPRDIPTAAIQNDTPSIASIIQSRGETIWSALIRFFQNNAIAGKPTGRSLNGAPFFFTAFRLPRQSPARTAATRSASLRDASTDASSNATFDRTTQT